MFDRIFGAEHESEDLPRSEWPAYVLFVVAVTAYVIHELVTRGQMILDGSMWAEMGPNYYGTTISEPWYAQLFATDAGYIPLPQRIIALACDVFGAPVASIPYLYTGSAVFISGLLIGAICLPAFRPVIESDLLRAALAMALILVPDFETRTFINFTYFTVVLAGFVTALAATSRHREVPAWSWVLPLLMISKPGVLTALPAMVVVALFSRRRFRWVTAASVLTGCAQAVQLAVTARSGNSLLQDSSATLFDKLASSAKYTLGILGRFTLGPTLELSIQAWMRFGLVVVVLSVTSVLLLRSRAGALILVGLSMVFFTMLVNSFTFSAAFTRLMPMLGVASFDRRYLVAVVGVLFVVAGLVASIVESPVIRAALARRGTRWTTVRARGGAVLSVAVLGAWFIGSGWLQYADRTNKPLVAPSSGVSQWGEAAPLLASDQATVCVPLDPFGWEYGRNCGTLSGSPVDPATVAFLTLPVGAAGQPQPLELAVPDAVTSERLASMAVVVRTASEREVRATAFVTGRNGTTTLRSSRTVQPTGGSLQFTVPSGATIDDVRSVVIQFDSTVEVASTTSGETAAALTLWMGHH